MTMRITGMATGLDIDSIVKDSMKPYQLRIDNQRKQKQILQWRQEQYQSIMKDVTSFYNKYLTVDGKNSLYSSSAYNQTKFTSANENVVSVTGSSNASISDYKVSVTQLAKKASAKVTRSELDDLVDTTNSYDVSTNFGGQTISFSAKIGDTANNVNAFKDAIANKKTDLENSKAGKSDSEIEEIQKQIDKLDEESSTYTEDDYKNMVNGLKVVTNNGLSVDVTGTSDNNQMKLVVSLGGKVDYSATADNYNANSRKAHVTARYSEISGGVVFESNKEGEGDFVVSGFSDGSTKTGTAQKLHATISNGSDVFTIDDTTNTEYNSSNRVTLDGMTFTFKDVTLKTNADGTYQKPDGGTTTNPSEAVNEPAKITGSKDVTALKDKIKSFV
ncbi:MAG: flagellar cap protein FliD N-terminal domain-containing protein, partial [Clostridiaceae bacterium]|nr:flagellar cap protein FliD N-terminal domain-containing protein [Clostridiaceae bacterium]